MTGDTVVAIATPSGRGGIGIVRVSGPAAAKLAQAITGIVPLPRQARFVRFSDAQGDVIDEGLVLLFKAPASFTGEDVLELHAHGSPVVLDMLVKRLVDLGARHAQAGEFSLRAFLNGKYDLAQLEAIATLISVPVSAPRAPLNVLCRVSSPRRCATFTRSLPLCVS